MGRPKRLYPHGRYRLRTPRQIENDKPYPLDLEYTWDRQAVRRTTNLFIKVTDCNQNGEWTRRDQSLGEILVFSAVCDRRISEIAQFVALKFPK